jgi:hypothetical protein
MDFVLWGLNFGFDRLFVIDLKQFFNVMLDGYLITTTYYIGFFDDTLKCCLKGHVLYFSSNYLFIVHIEILFSFI